jgi:hypothetical protein
MNMIRCAPGRTSRLLVAQDVNAAISIVPRDWSGLRPGKSPTSIIAVNCGTVLDDVNGRQDASN